ncbi:MAG: alpha/beta hydrolase [Deltaproteobacteria bacterium]|nr:alpha/beta hydrolase [Deltaproteobacteria bacterium]
MPLDEDVKQMMALLSPPGAPALHELGVEMARQAMNSLLGTGAEPEPVARVENRDIPGPNGPIPVRIYTPQGKGPHPALVYFHGGGWVLGNLETHDASSRSLTNQVGCVVVSVDYRLAPEHKFPCAIEDCYAATAWVAANARELDVDAARIAIGGDSAGGNLTATVALAAKERGGPRIVHQLLIYPVTDARMETVSYRENADGYFLTAGSMQWFWEQYLSCADDRTNPLASPECAKDLGGLPPATVITAEFDPLRDEGEAYGERLRAAGVPTEIRRWDGVIHGFFGMTMGLEKGRDAMQYAARQLRSAFGM